jgi:hypothetical protein
MKYSHHQTKYIGKYVGLRTYIYQNGRRYITEDSLLHSTVKTSNLSHACYCLLSLLFITYLFKDAASVMDCAACNDRTTGQ